MIDLFDQGVAYYKNNIAFIDGDSGKQTTYSAASARSHAIASAIRSHGYHKGAKIAVLAPNGSDAFAALLGLMRAEGAWLPVNPRNSVAVSADLLERFDGDLLFYHSTYTAEARLLLEQVPSLREAVCLDRDTGFGTFLEDWIPDHNAKHEMGPLEPGDLSGIFPTGGTTGKPKGVLLTHEALATFSANMMTHLSYHDYTRHLVVAPMTHTAGNFGCLHFARGGCNISMSTTEPAAVLKMLEKHRITHVFMPPTLLYMVLADPNVRNHDYSSLTHLMIGAAPCSLEKLKEAISVFGPVLAEFYGQVEAPAAVCIKAPWDYVREDGTINESRLHSVGRPGIWNKVAILDDAGIEVPRGAAGEICVRGPIVTPGYYRNPEATAERRKWGWHLTGDVGVMDDDGYVTIVDRKSEMIITGGFNVFPNEIEQALSAHSNVQDCSVIGVPDEKWGEAVKAFVQLKAGMSADVPELLDLVRAKLGPVKTPKSIDFIAELPRSPAGKVLRSELRKPFWTGKDRGVN